MTWVIRQSPIFDQPTEAPVDGERVLVRAYQIVVWVSLKSSGALSPRFPAVLDTGLNFTFAISELQLQAWACLAVTDLQTIGRTRINKQYLELKKADVAVWSNVSGKRDELIDRAPFLMSFREGIAVYPRDNPLAPRLPLLGLRALMQNDLKLTVDGKRNEMDLEHF